MSVIEFDNASRPRIYSRDVLSECPECDGELSVLRVIGGRAGCEYWTMRCTDCGGIHLDILKPHRAAVDDEGSPPAA
ncbi:hypothetical protein I3J27_05795 [Bradyrhizobium xenonodulans]|uniref:Transcription factor zinc-finger domain-containing protein n=1 Tax=Bradyrhizobium xenonodulans TaxID=2736875 RepID=A0ABY7MNI0_9BRAD|nr:hypothetical protein [Bradyrhizobium xenonodulans]WBL79942.1 hypothetical protein I3J27_05795 [Bradyrhizobium xenonodulans]